MTEDTAQDDSPYTLEKFNNEIVRPMVLTSLKNGKFDSALTNLNERQNIIINYSHDLEMLKAIITRIEIISKE